MRSTAKLEGGWKIEIVNKVVIWPRICHDICASKTTKTKAFNCKEKKCLVVKRIYSFWSWLSIAVQSLQWFKPLPKKKKVNHTVRNLHFLSKNPTLIFPISRENCRFFGVKNSWKCCGFGLFCCWQLWFHKKNCQKSFEWKTRENVGGSVKIEFLGQKFDFSNSV